MERVVRLVPFLPFQDVVGCFFKYGDSSYVVAIHTLIDLRTLPHDVDNTTLDSLE